MGEQTPGRGGCRGEGVRVPAWEREEQHAARVRSEVERGEAACHVRSLFNYLGELRPGESSVGRLNRIKHK
jgi:hypothetical protein